MSTQYGKNHLFFFSKYPLCHCERVRMLSGCLLQSTAASQTQARRRDVKVALFHEQRGNLEFFSAKLTQQNVLLARTHSDFM